MLSRIGIKACLSLLTLLMSVNAFAVIVISADDVSGAPGGTVVVSLVFDCQAGETPQAAQWDVEYDATLFSSVDVSTCLDNADTNLNSCVVAGNGDAVGVGTDAIRVALLNNPAANVCPDAVPSQGSVGTVSFTIDNAAAPQVVPLVIADEVIDGGFATSFSDGSITIQAPAGQGFYTSSPAPGGTITFPPAVVGDTATPDQVVAVSNASPDTAFNVTGVNVAPPLSNSDIFPILVAAGGSQDVTFSCSPDARGDINGTFEITHDSVNGAASPVQYNYECVGLAPNVQVPAGPVNISGLTVDPNPLTATFDVTNPQDGFTSNAENVTISAVGDPQITVGPAGPSVIAPDGTLQATISCDNTAAGNFSSTITVEWDDPVSAGTASDTLVANCEVIDAVPSFASTPTAPGPLAFGTVTNGVTSAPIGIDVTNDGIGPSPDSDLTITSAIASDPQYAVNVIDSGPFVIGADAGDTDIEVTCTPDAGTDGPLPAATLTVNHNGDDDPTVFDLTCSGELDGEFDSDPASGGILNLGVVPPNTTTPEGTIDFFNNGAVDDISVSCTLTDPQGVMNFTPNPLDFIIGPDGSDSAAFQCTPTSPSSFQADLACTITGDQQTTAANYTIVCQGQPLVVPTMNQWGLIIMSLLLLMVAGLFGRRWFANQA